MRAIAGFHFGSVTERSFQEAERLIAYPQARPMAWYPFQFFPRHSFGNLEMIQKFLSERGFITHRSQGCIDAREPVNTQDMFHYPPDPARDPKWQKLRNYGAEGCVAHRPVYGATSSAYSQPQLISRTDPQMC